MSIGDPLTRGQDALESLKMSDDVPPYSLHDPSKSSLLTDPILRASSKRYNFLVLHHENDSEAANQIYDRLEEMDLCGYKYERDKVIGKDKLTLEQNAIEQSEVVILLLSNSALESPDFQHKTQLTITTPSTGVIPVRHGIRREEVPRALRNHVDIQYGHRRFWNRLEESFVGPRHFPETKKPSEEAGTSQKSKQETRSLQSPVSRKKTEKTTNTRGSDPPSKQNPPPTLQKNSRASSLLGIFKTKRSNPSNAPTEIQLKPVKQSSRNR
ncbi:uncharacterized protein [Diadema antillarum]|uniref:uncharacterized protein n=1 Tax=Diadema antillarum TaxID=105358 RepID=UPI003A8992F9